MISEMRRVNGRSENILHLFELRDLQTPKVFVQDRAQERI